MVVRVQFTVWEIFPPEPSHDRALGSVHRQVFAKGSRHVLLALGGLDRYILRHLSFLPLSTRSTPWPSRTVLEYALLLGGPPLSPNPLLPLTNSMVLFQPPPQVPEVVRIFLHPQVLRHICS